MKNEKNNGSKVVAQNGPVGIEESAQYEVFRNQDLSRDTVDQWCGNDLESIRALVQIIMDDPIVRGALVDAMYARYKKYVDFVNSNGHDKEAVN